MTSTAGSKFHCRFAGIANYTASVNSFAGVVNRKTDGR